MNKEYKAAIKNLRNAIINDRYRNDPYYQTDNDPMMNVLATREDYQQVGLSQVFHEIAFDLLRLDRLAGNDSEAVYDFIGATFADLIAFDVSESA